MVYKLKRSIF